MIDRLVCHENRWQELGLESITTAFVSHKIFSFYSGKVNEMKSENEQISKVQAMTTNATGYHSILSITPIESFHPYEFSYAATCEVMSITETEVICSSRDHKRNGNKD